MPAPIPLPEGQEQQAGTEAVKGNWQGLVDTANTLRGFANEASQGRDKLAKLDDPKLWQGGASAGFRKDLGIVVDILELYSSVYPRAADEIKTYADALWAAQDKTAKDHIPKAQEATTKSRTWRDQKSAYDTAKTNNQSAVTAGVDESTLPPLPNDPGEDPGARQRREAETELGATRETLNDAAATCALKMTRLMNELNNAPDLYKWIQRETVEFIKGIGAGTLDLANFAWTIDPARVYVDGPGAYFTDLAKIAAGMTKPVWDPLGFAADTRAQVIQSWEDFKKAPGRTAGTTVPDLALAFITKGGFKARTPKERADFDAKHNHDTSCRDPRSCGLVGEPVDIATGEMVLDHVDVDLPGTLPLVLERRHRTHFDRGRWFGRRWCSTFDQHLALTPEGVRLILADGVELAYPVPEPGGTVQPVGGARWPLHWDGRPGGVFTLTDPQSGRAWTFAPHPALRDPVLPVTSLADRNGNRVEYLYDAEGTPCEVRHSGGYRIAVDTADGRITGYRLLGADPATHLRSDDPAHSIRLRRFGYAAPDGREGTGDLTESIDSTGLPMVFGYDGQHRLTSWTDRLGDWYQYTYDDAGRCVHGTGSEGFLDNTFAYDDTARVTRMTDANGAVWEYAWDEWGRMVRRTDPLGNTARQEWDPYNRLAATIDPHGAATRFSYDEAGNRTGIVYADGSYTIIDYDTVLNVPLRIINPDTTVQRFTYDERGNMLTETDELGAESAYAYDNRGGLVSARDPLGGIAKFARDAAGLAVLLADPTGATVRAERDAFGRTAATTDANGATTRLAWTVEGLPAWCEHPGGGRESWTYDPSGNLVAHLDAAGGISRFAYGPFGLRIAQTAEDGTRHTFAHDRESRLASVTGPDGATWSYTYDAAGRTLTDTDFDGRTLCYEHDAAGQVTAQVNGAGQRIEYRRNVFGQVVEARHADTGHATTFTYNTARHLASVTGPDARLVYERDAHGRVVAETCNGRRNTYAFDALGRLTRRTLPDGQATDWTYDPAGRLTRIATGGHTIAFVHNALGRETERRYDGRIRFGQEWNAGRRIAAHTISVGDDVDPVTAALSPGLGPAELLRRTYGYRADGYLTSVDDSVRGRHTYDLDPAGRVTRVTGADRSEQYAYDAAGNLSFGTAGQASGDDPQHRPSGHRVTRAGPDTFAYDGQGRMVRRTRQFPSGDVRSWTFTWDADDRLRTATTPDGACWHYAYDPLGRRIAKRRPDDPSQDVEFVWDGMRLAQEVTAAGTTTWHYDAESWRPVSRSHYTASGSAESADFHAVATDLAGAPTELLDEQGEIVWQRHTTLWGARPDDTHDPFEVRLRFPGQYHDAETGLSYNFFRYYCPETASYISPDPLGLEAGPRPYAYVRNPNALVDPLGLKPLPERCTVLTPTLLQHVLKGEFDELTKKITGWHLHPDQHPGGVIPPDRYASPNQTVLPNGVVKVNGPVGARDADGNYYPKDTKFPHTFFPSTWDAEKIIQAGQTLIKEGKVNSTGSRVTMTIDGVNITGLLSRTDGKLTLDTFFPSPNQPG
ncbi:DUF6531 domain-containing protein [Yinghuangia soli]|uniref:DUF6531 domain-containing protein n=1 Tax=Yinghuangia soli TaxID=2908204 RepID=A0AA41Q657_9ACTN|nr:DUF6531 domain-containing protein [Yinghuangia soli]MCF2532294.1 DUF6531 domain-containing protein [Yinghuangia soli]